ncbi:MAG: F0F1 ATP synthase subunit C [Holosporales bacterium]|jgi:F-type H+-transporting ATPase subunit c|nr:F0F1 ATP synthase subunit C [Holosporales bacterium]MDR1366255.1 F0F1 ATP synthase subunit C [Holosporales bacterium]
METEAARMISAAVALFALFGVGLSMGNIFSTWLSSIAKNPSAKDDLFPVGVLGFALTEAIALFALLISFLILFK